MRGRTLYCQIGKAALAGCFFPLVASSTPDIAPSPLTAPMTTPLTAAPDTAISADDALMNTYERLSVGFVRGAGCWLYDQAGERYLDALSGIAVCGLGHAHPAVTATITAQAGKLLHTSNYYHCGEQERLAARLAEISGMERVFFGNSGAEANEAAIKIARLYGHLEREVRTPAILVMENAFHGRTLATLSATAKRSAQAGFEPLVPGFVRAPYNDLEALQRIAANNRDIVAVLVEPIQGDGGVHVPDADFLPALRRCCDEKGWLLMLDEIQTGNGRSGRFFAYQHHDVLPDVVTTAKGLANGLPIGACLARGRAAELLTPGSHGSTFGGNPLVCSVANTVLDVLEQENLYENAARMGEFLRQALQDQCGLLPAVQEVRGEGLILGLQLRRPCMELMAQALEQRLLLSVVAEDTIRLLPPLILQQEEAERIVAILCPLLRACSPDVPQARTA